MNTARKKELADPDGFRKEVEPLILYAHLNALRKRSRCTALELIENISYGAARSSHRYTPG